MECIQCGETIKEGKWCTIGCKERFYMENYLGSSLIQNLEDWYGRKKRLDYADAMREFTAWQEKNIGKGFVEYLQSLGDFKPETPTKKQ